MIILYDLINNLLLYLANKLKNKPQNKDNSKNEYYINSKSNEGRDNIDSRSNTKNLTKDNFNKTDPNSQEILFFRNSKFGSNSENILEGKGFVGCKLEKSKQEEVKYKIKNIESKKIKTLDLNKNSMVLSNYK